MEVCLHLARSHMMFPVTVEPVKPMPAVSGCALSASPTTEPLPITRLTAPAGRPTPSKHFISALATAAVVVAGFHTIGSPTAMPAAR